MQEEENVRPVYTWKNSQILEAKEYRISNYAFSESNFFISVFSLFSIIRFQNDICNVTVNEQGVCYTSHECEIRGGRAAGSCAAGFGTCCVCKKSKKKSSSFFRHFPFSVAESCNGIKNEKVVYFQNPSYPTEDNLANYCSYSVKVWIYIAKYARTCISCNKLSCHSVKTFDIERTLI